MQETYFYNHYELINLELSHKPSGNIKDKHSVYWKALTFSKTESHTV